MQQLHPASDQGTSAICAREVLDAVPPAVWFIRGELRKFRKGLSMAQFRALAFLRRQPAVSLSAVAEHLGSSLPTASRVVAGLVDKGLLARKGCVNDRRQLELVITPRGEATLQTAWGGTQARLEQVIATLEPGKRENLVDAMKTLKSLFGSLGLCDEMSASIGSITE